jgi:hemolysin D
MMQRIQATFDLLRHYAKAFSAAWQVRGALATPNRMDHELAFLPASLELVERPVHPAPRWTMVIVSMLAVLTLLVSVVGRLDIVVSSHGKLIPGVRVKVVQPAVTGVVQRILVQDGQRVHAGDLLMQLDPTQASADADKTHAGRMVAALGEARAAALLNAQRQEKPPRLGAVDGAWPDDIAQAQRLADSIYLEYRDRLSSAEATTRQREAELETTRLQIDKLRATVPLARQQANNYKSLVDRKYVTETDYLDKESAALQQEHEIVAQSSHAHELEAAISAQRAELASITSQYVRTQLDALEKARQELTQDIGDETKATMRRSLMDLRAPANGIIQQLQVHTVGGVVTAAQTVMEIVPDDTLEVESTIENKDVGFVRVGQPVSVKIEAFPYTRYGTIEGVVTLVATDAVPDRRSGLAFVAHIRIPTDQMQVGDQHIQLTPGMAVTAEIKTGRQSVASFLVAPLLQTAQESLRER